ncbi:hypothetical protein GYMLUDRAFT_55822 [Collybiopsis luxurians FD-317 M1]|nr:hypothetical protein GYMLUDRAFT_55822 [Collybiopsis luxurians FD-317 M1]
MSAQPPAPAATPYYPYDLPALSILHPAILPIQVTPILHRGISQNDPLDESHIDDAQRAIQYLEALLGEGAPGVTHDVVRTAVMRHSALLNIHAVHRFGLGDILVSLNQLNAQFTANTNRPSALENQLNNRLNALENHANNRLNNLQASFDIMSAQLANTRRHSPSECKKTVPGTGNADPLRPHYLNTSVTPLLVSNNPPAIGTEYDYPVGRICDMTHIDILNAIVFYNEDFGVVQTDELEDRKAKFTRWHTQDI